MMRLALARLDGQGEVADGVQEMRLSEADAAINEEGVINLARVVGDGEARSVCELIACPDDKVLESILGLEEVGRGGCFFRATFFFPMRASSFSRRYSSRSVLLRRFLEQGLEQGLEILDNPVAEEGIGNNDRADTVVVSL